MKEKIQILIALILPLISLSQACTEFEQPESRLSSFESSNDEVNSRNVFVAYSKPEVVRRLELNLNDSTYNKILEEDIDFTRFENLTHLSLFAEKAVDISFILSDLYYIKKFGSLGVSGGMDVSGLPYLSSLSFGQNHLSNDSLQMHASIFKLKNLDVLRLFLSELSALPPLTFASDLSCLYINANKLNYFPPSGSDLKSLENIEIYFESDFNFNFNNNVFQDIKTIELQGNKDAVLTIESNVNDYSGELTIICSTLVGLPEFLKRCQKKSRIVVFTNYLDFPRNYVFEPINADYISIHIGKTKWKSRRSFRKLKRVSEKFNSELEFILRK